MKKIDRIAIFTMESLYSCFALNMLLPLLHDRVKIICISQTYGKRRGGFFKQLKKNLTHSGFSFTMYLSAVFLDYLFIIYFFNLIHLFSPRKNRMLSLRALAKKYNIEIFITDNINSPHSEEKLRALNLDLIISFYFDQKIKKNIYGLPSDGAINVHPGILPEYRGPFPTFWKIKHHEQYSGITIHHIDDAFDTGHIILQEKVEIRGATSLIAADKKIFALAPNLVMRALGEIEHETAGRHTQQGGNYHSCPKKADVSEFTQEAKIPLYTMRDLLSYYK
jgi:folate-dependent phosphoribosylglycinamide formyltransferase PurN